MVSSAEQILPDYYAPSMPGLLTDVKADIHIIYLIYMQANSYYIIFEKKSDIIQYYKRVHVIRVIYFQN